MNGIADLKDLSDEDEVVHFVKRVYLEGSAYNKSLLFFIDARFYRNSIPTWRCIPMPRPCVIGCTTATTKRGYPMRLPS